MSAPVTLSLSFTRYGIMIFFFPARGLTTTFEVDVYLDPPSFSPLPLRYLTDLTDFEALRPFFFRLSFFSPSVSCVFFFFFVHTTRWGVVVHLRWRVSFCLPGFIFWSNVEVNYNWLEWHCDLTKPSAHCRNVSGIQGNQLVRIQGNPVG
jgi:hypothetical protein